MQHILNLHTWVSLPNEVRFKIRTLFRIPCSGNAHVDDGRLMTDGTSPDDFKALTIEKMQDYLKSTETDFHKLFDGVVASITRPPAPLEVTEGLEIHPAPKKLGRPKKNA